MWGCNCTCVCLFLGCSSGRRRIHRDHNPIISGLLAKAVRGGVGRTLDFHGSREPTSGSRRSHSYKSLPRNNIGLGATRGHRLQRAITPATKPARSVRFCFDGLTNSGEAFSFTASMKAVMGQCGAGFVRSHGGSSPHVERPGELARRQMRRGWASRKQAATL